VEGRLSRGQIVVYAALGVVLLLLGVRALGGESAPASDSGGAIEITGGGAGGSAGRDLVVHVAGAVREPGVYRLPGGARVAEALERAGGANRSGAADAINLAAPLSDGQQIVVPEVSPDGAGTPAVGQEASGGPVSLGSASAVELEQIDGIGPVTAEKIIAFREERGGIGAIEELDEIPGIGPATIESLSAGLQP